MNYSTVLGANQNLGLSVGVNFARTAAERHNNEHKWGSEDTVGGVEIPYALTNTEAQFSANDRDRFGANARLEVRINDDHKLDFSLMQNYREDDQDRQITRVRWDKGDYISPTEVEGLRMVKSLHDRLEEPVHHAGAHVLEHRVGLLAQAEKDLAIALVLEIEHDAALVAVDAAEVAAEVATAVDARLALGGMDEVLRDRRRGARHVAPRRLHLDHVGAEVGEDRRAEGPGERHRAVEDDEVAERALAHGRLLPDAGRMPACHPCAR